MTVVKKYSRRNDANVGHAAVRTYIEVENKTIKEAWFQAPMGDWRGNNPTYLHGLKIDQKWLDERDYKEEL